MGYGSDGQLFSIQDSTLSPPPPSSMDSNTTADSSDTLTFDNYDQTSNSLLLSSPIILELNFSQFIVGRDGSCSIAHKGVIVTSLIRSMSYLIIDIVHDNKSSHINEIENIEVSIELSLRGNMFGDEVFNLPLKFKINSRDSEISKHASDNKEDGYHLNSEHQLPDSYRMSIKI